MGGHGQFPGYGNPFTSSTIPMPYNYEYQYPTEMSYSAPSFAYKDNVMTYKYPEMSYKTDTANATGFFNGGFPGHGNLFGYGGFPGNSNVFGYGGFPGTGNPFTSSQWLNIPMPYNYEYQYPTEMS